MQVTAHNIVQYDYARPRILKPLVYSLLIHGLLGIFALNTDSKPEPVNSIVIVIDNEEDAVEVVESVESEPEKADENKESETESNNNNPEGINAYSDSYGENDQFYREFEDNLIRKNTNTQTRDYNSENEEQGWAEEKIEKIETGKSETTDKVEAPGSAGMNSGKTVWVEGTPRVLIYKPKIEYPLYFRKRGIQAEVQIQIVINREGHVVSAEVIKSSGETKLDILARNGMMEARYKPKDSGGQDVAYVTVEFTLND